MDSTLKLLFLLYYLECIDTLVNTSTLYIELIVYVLVLHHHLITYHCLNYNKIQQIYYTA